jgi:Protein of unknown function (DUF1761)
MTVPINYLAVIVAAVVNMIIGALWYGPFFGKAWSGLIGMTHEKMEAMKAKGMGSSYALMFIGSLLMSWVLAHALIFGNAYLKTGGVGGGVMVGFFNWVGFIAPVTLGVVLWEGKPWKLWFINSFYYLFSLCVMGVFLSFWM